MATPDGGDESDSLVSSLPPTIARGIIAAHYTKIDNSNADAADGDDVDRSLGDAASSKLSCRLKRSWEHERQTTSWGARKESEAGIEGDRRGVAGVVASDEAASATSALAAAALALASITAAAEARYMGIE